MQGLVKNGRAEQVVVVGAEWISTRRAKRVQR